MYTGFYGSARMKFVVSKRVREHLAGLQGELKWACFGRHNLDEWLLPIVQSKNAQGCSQPADSCEVNHFAIFLGSV